MCGHPAGRYHIIHHLIKKAYGRKKNGWLDILVIIIGWKCQIGGTFWAYNHPIGRLLRLLAMADDLGDCAWSGAAVSQSSGSHSASWQDAWNFHPKPQEIPAICHPYKITFLHLNCHFEAEEFVLLQGETLNTTSVFLTEHCIIKNPPAHLPPSLKTPSLVFL